jgi:hypothetical protein
VSEDFLKNPLSLFDVSGKTAVVTERQGRSARSPRKYLRASAPMS